MYRVKTAASSEPITLTEAKLHLKVDISDDDNLITALIKTAREMVEQYCNRPMMPTVYEYYADNFETELNLRQCPVSAVSEIAYIAEGSNIYTTVTDINYITDIYSEPARIKFTSDYSTPAVANRMNNYRVTFTAGYANAAIVPAPLKAAMLLIIGHLYDNREDVVVGRQVNQLPKGSEYLMNPYRIFEF